MLLEAHCTAADMTHVLRVWFLCSAERREDVTCAGIYLVHAPLQVAHQTAADLMLRCCMCGVDAVLSVVRT